MPSLIAALLALLLLWPHGAGAQSCAEIRFAPGATSAEIAGSAPAEAVVCYSFATGAGQQARVELLEGRNTAFSIDGLVDARDDYSFRTEARSYRLRVFQLMRAVRDQPFRIRLSVTGGGAGVGNAGGHGWRSVEGGVMASANGVARDGRTRAMFQCRAGGPGRATLQLSGDPAQGLPMRDGESARVTIEIEERGGMRRFETVLTRHDGNDQWWDAVDAFGGDFLDAFAAGRMMALRAADGTEVARFDLRGSARARRAMQAKCGF